MTRPARASEWLGSVAFNLCFFGATVPFVIAALATQVFSRTLSEKVVSAWGGAQLMLLRLFLGVRVRQEGAPLTEPALYAIKHESFFEAIDCPRLFHRPVPFPKAELMEIPLWGAAARRFGVVAVEREEGASALRKMVSEARRFIAEGRPLVIFPEGTRVPHGARPDLKSGLAGLYRLLGVPVVPVAVDSGPVYAGWLKRSGTITYRFGEPIPLGLSRDEFEARVHAGINALNP